MWIEEFIMLQNAKDKLSNYYHDTKHPNMTYEFINSSFKLTLKL